MTSTTPQLTLYGYFRSSASARVRTVMELHGIAREDKFVHLLKGEQKSAEYTAMNPAQTLPTLVMAEADGSEWNLSQCIAIMEYLDETFGGSSKVGYLLPRDARSRATVRSIVDLVVGDLFPMLTMGTLNRVKGLGADSVEWAQICSKQFLSGKQRNDELNVLRFSW
jgi:maleylacetoacetate isomerase